MKRINANSEIAKKITVCIHRKWVVQSISFAWFFGYTVYLIGNNIDYTSAESMLFYSAIFPSFYVSCQFLAIGYVKYIDKNLLPKYGIIDTAFGVTHLIMFLLCSIYVLLHV